MNSPPLCDEHQKEADFSVFDKYIDTENLKLNNYTFYEKLIKLKGHAEKAFVKNVTYRLAELKELAK